MNSFPVKLEERPEIRQLVKEFADGIGVKEPLTRQFLLVAVQAARVFDYKQGKYGPGNIAEFGETGVMIRMSDKLKRLANLWRTGQSPADETVEDSWGDAANYAIIALMCRYGFWPGVTPERETPETVRAERAAQERIMVASLIVMSVNTDQEKVASLRKLLELEKPARPEPPPAEKKHECSCCPEGV